jgi:SAM-dependent methyltransferase
MSAERFFDSIARRYDRVYAPSSRDTRARMERVLAEIPAGARVLDLGVGTGRELSILQDAGHTVVGVDVSREMLAICARRARPIELVRANFWEPLAFGDASFDAVIALHGTLAHPPNGAASVASLARGIARVLTPGGAFVAELPSRARRARATRGDDERRVRIIAGVGAGDVCVYEDIVTGASIEAWVPDVTAWRVALGAALAVSVDPIGEDELIVRARRA